MLRHNVGWSEYLAILKASEAINSNASIPCFTGGTSSPQRRRRKSCALLFLRPPAQSTRPETPASLNVAMPACAATAALSTSRHTAAPLASPRRHEEAVMTIGVLAFGQGDVERMMLEIGELHRGVTQGLLLFTVLTHYGSPVAPVHHHSQYAGTKLSPEPLQLLPMSAVRPVPSVQ